jgi:hypothetical protein
VICIPSALTPTHWQHDQISCMNRLEDTLCRWRSVVSESILFNTPILLFLTGCNVLRDKLAAGTRLSDYMVSYGNRPNDYKSVIKCATAYHPCILGWLTDIP